jgi:HlyD family secretion protein
MREAMRRLLAALLLLAGLGAGVFWFGAPVASALNLPWPGGGSEANGPRPRTAAVDRGAITAAVSATGTVNPLVTVSVGSQLSGQIRELLADFNTRVTAGQPVARLDTAQLEARRAAAAADLRAAEVAVRVAEAGAEKAEADAAQAEAQVLSAEAGVSSAEATLRDAEYESRRTEELRRGGHGAVRDAVRASFTTDRARADLANARATVAQRRASRLSAEASARTARAQVEAARATEAQRAAQLRQVEVDLGFATIRSPIDGVVVSRNVDLGQTVAASFQAPVLFSIAANLEEMEIWATVDEADIGRIRPGQEVPFTVAAYPGETLSGRVKEIRLAAQTVSNVVTYTVVVTVPNAGGRLLPGMTATLRIVTEHRADALRVPNAALRWRPSRSGGAGGGEAAEGRGGGGGSGGGGSGLIEQVLRELPDLSPAQRAEIEAAQAEMRERVANLPRNPEGRQGQMQSARQRLISRVNAALSPEQRARLSELRGSRGTTGTVWVAEEGAPPRAVPVRIGVTDGTVTEIVSGDLAPGQAVVVGLERQNGGGGGGAAAGASAAQGSGGRRLRMF